jgi:hypothetical protein
MSEEPKTLAERLDAATTGQEFGQVIVGLFDTLEQKMDNDE